MVNPSITAIQDEMSEGDAIRSTTENVLFEIDNEGDATAKA